MAQEAERRPAVVVRPAQEEDLPAILDLLEAVAAEGRWLGTEAPVDRAARMEVLAARVAGGTRAVHYVAVSEGEMVGQLSMELQASNVAELGMLVAREWRGRGIGTALVEAGLQWARAAGSHKVTLQMWPHNDAARALYRKFGFVEEGRLHRHYRRRNGELWDAVVMGLVLDEDSPGSPLHARQ